MTLDDLRAELEAGRVRCSYLIVGAEPLLRDDALEAIRIAALDDGPSDFDYERLDGGVVTGASLLDAVRTLPVLAPRRLVVLREPEAARAKARGLTDALNEALVAVKDRRDTVLVVLAEKVDGRSRWVKVVGSAATVRCDPPRKGQALSQFIAAEASRQGIALDRAAISLLAERTGPQLLVLRQEIAKAALFAGLGEKVTAKHVAESTSDVAEEPIWDLTDAIGEGRCGDAAHERAQRRCGHRAALRDSQIGGPVPQIQPGALALLPRCNSPDRPRPQGRGGGATGTRVGAPGDRPRQLTARPLRTPARDPAGVPGVPGYRGGGFAGSARSESILILGEAGDASARALLRDRPLRRGPAKDALGGLDCCRRLFCVTRCQCGPSALDR